MPREVAIADKDRVHYFEGTTRSLLAAIREDGVDIRAYFPWSEFDRCQKKRRNAESHLQVSLTILNGQTDM